MTFNKKIAAVIITALFSCHSFSSLADNDFYHVQPVSVDGNSAQSQGEDDLPDIGTTAGNILSINQEIQMGTFYLQKMRAVTPLINDPLLEQYVNNLGAKLVAHAYSVKTPFNFLLVKNDELNAFAFFGGNVVLHSSLFRYTDNESQLASVMAHEISHVTQRHLARAMEDQKNHAPLTWVGALGSMLLATASPQAGMAALTTTIAGTQQGIISFTQANEQEADRLGIQLLQRAGFDASEMSLFLQKLADQSRTSSTPPEMLLTHPLPDSRLADVRSRAAQMRAQPHRSSRDYYLAKVRVSEMYASQPESQKQALREQLAAGGPDEQAAANYGEAMHFFENNENEPARKIVDRLLQTDPNNTWYLDLMTDIDISQHHANQAVSRLLNVDAEKSQDPVIRLNLANAYIESGNAQKAVTLLNHYTFSHPQSVNAWDLLTRAASLNGDRCGELSSRAEFLALKGDAKQAILLFNQAGSGNQCTKLERARNDARIDQLQQLQTLAEQYEHSGL